MIKRINTLKRIGRFTELRGGRGTDNDFVELNVLFGSNASRKSTLCDVLRSMTTGEAAYVMGRKRFDATGEPEIVVALNGANTSQTVRFQNGAWANATASPKIHIYDDRFIAENVLVGQHIDVDQRRNLYGLVIGAAGVALKQAVDAAEGDLTATGLTATTAKTTLEALIPQGHQIASFRNLPQVDDVDRKIATATEALASATQTKSKADAIRQRNPLRPVPIAQIPTDLGTVLAGTLDQAALVAEQRIREHLHTHTDGLTVEWLGQGHRAQKGTGCPHCGQDMEGLDILQAYRAFFSGELKTQERLRNTTKAANDSAFGDRAQSELRGSLLAHDTERTWWEDAAGFRFELPPIRDSAAVVAGLSAVHQVVTTVLVQKQANPGNAITFTPADQQAIDDWESIAAELRAYNQGLIAINETLTNKKAEAEGIDLAPLNQALSKLEASKKRHQQEVIDVYSAYDSAVRAKTDAQSAKKAANDALRDQSNDLLAQYGTRINALLDLFATDFRIVCGGSNENYVTFGGGRPAGQLAIEIFGKKIASSPADAGDPARSSLANTLSGGDRSALALAFFLAKVEQEPDLADSVVVFDDPFHSQDRSRQRRMIERIHGIAREAKQCFVFSHDLDFARAVEPIQGVASRSFLLDPLADQSTLEAKELPMLPSRAYEAKYALLTNYIRNPADFVVQLNNIAGTLRTILEEYLQLKFPQRWEEGQDWFGTMIGKIRTATGDDPLVRCQGLVDELTQVNEYSQRFHHRTTGATADVPDARELVTYTKQTLSIIHK